MNTAIALPRLVIPVPELTKFFTDSRRILGTHAMLTIRSREAALLLCLQEMGIAPFLQTAVDEYKAKRMAEARKGVGLFNRRSIKWRQAYAKFYNRPMPLEIVQRANDLVVRLNNKDNSADIRFGIDYLANQKEHMTNKEWVEYDPFLMVRVQRRTDERDAEADEVSGWHYIGVWDEPGFAI